MRRLATLRARRPGPGDRALSHPPPPWNARLARWFDEFVPRPEPVRMYARPSRRQSSTPDIPRAGPHLPPEEIARRTFGVVLDTSGSMDRDFAGPWPAVHPAWAGLLDAVSRSVIG
jgi:hypothetical protein